MMMSDDNVREPLRKKRRMTKRRLAEEAGMSLHKMRQCIRVAAIPEDQFEELVESDSPPTIEALANLGRRLGKPRKPPAVTCPTCGGSGKVRPEDCGE